MAIGVPFISRLEDERVARHNASRSKDPAAKGLKSKDLVSAYQKLTPEQQQKLPDSVKAQVVSASLTSSPLVRVGRKMRPGALALQAGRILAGAEKMSEDISDVEFLAYRAINSLGRSVARNKTADHRFERNAAKIEAETEKRPQRTGLDILKDQIIPGSASTEKTLRERLHLYGRDK